MLIGFCEFCGESIERETVKRGRVPRFCSNACRAAGYRERKKEQQIKLQRELEKAQQAQKNERETRRSDEIFFTYESLGRGIISARERLRSLDNLTPEQKFFVEEVRKTARAIEILEAPDPASLSRQQRRRLERMKKR